MADVPAKGDYNWMQCGTLENLKDGGRVEYSIVGPKGGEAYFEFEDGPTLDLAELRHSISVPYTVPKPEGGFRKLDSFTEAQIEAIYPFALVLACLDGNAFVNREKPEFDLVRQYVPEAFAVLDMNGCVELTETGARFRSDRPEPELERSTSNL